MCAETWALRKPGLEALPGHFQGVTRPALLLAGSYLCALLTQGAWAQSPQPETSACVRPLSKEVKNRTVFVGTRVFDTAVPHEDTKPMMILMKGFTLRVVGRFQEWVQLKGSMTRSSVRTLPSDGFTSLSSSR